MTKRNLNKVPDGGLIVCEDSRHHQKHENLENLVGVDADDQASTVERAEIPREEVAVEARPASCHAISNYTKVVGRLQNTTKLLISANNYGI